MALRVSNGHESRSSDQIQSVHRIIFPCQVQSHIGEKYNLTSTDGFIKAVHVTLREREERYGVIRDSASSEIC